MVCFSDQFLFLAVSAMCSPQLSFGSYSWLRLANVTISLTAGCCHHFPTLLLFAIRMPTDKTPSAVGFGQHSDAAAQALHQSLAMDKTFQKAIAHMSGSAPLLHCST